MPARVLQCSVCHHKFDTRRGWLNHLLQPYHQTKARKEICHWDQPERECVLVAFSTSPIATHELLHFFSSGTMNLVTDLVWFENRPKTGFIQFESKHKVEEILSNFSGPEIRINNQLVQIKKGGDCLRLEWQELIPVQNNELFEQEAGETISYGVNSQNNRTNNVVKVCPKVSLANCYHSICQVIEIREEECQKAQEFLKTLQSLFAKEFPDCQLILFRNWYLKLRTTSQADELVFFLDPKGMYSTGEQIPDNYFSHDQLVRDTKRRLRKLLQGTPEAKSLGIKKVKGKISEHGFQTQDIYNFYCEASQLLCSVVPQPYFYLPEIQACRLLLYLCTFDPRVKSLLTVIRYWAKINLIYLGKPGESSRSHAPDPAALDWLVIFFLCHKMKILPTPREITERPHPRLEFAKIDTGFVEDNDFAQQYSCRYKAKDKEAHAFNVFSLATKFFNFYSKQLRLANGTKLVLNTKDGEIIPMENFIGQSCGTFTKLTMFERRSAKKGRIGVNLSPALVLLHPLNQVFGFSFCDKNFVTSLCPAMKTTRNKLKQALNLYKNGSKLEEMESVLKIN